MSTAAADQKLRRMTHTAQRRRLRRGSRAGPPLARRARGQRRRARAAPAAARPVQAALCVPPRAACCDRAQRFYVGACRKKYLPRESPRGTASPNAGTHNSLGNEQRPTVFDDKLRTPSDSTRAHPGSRLYGAPQRHDGTLGCEPWGRHVRTCTLLTQAACLRVQCLSTVRACLHGMCCRRVTRAPHPRRCITSGGWWICLKPTSGRRRTAGGRRCRQAAQRASRART